MAGKGNLEALSRTQRYRFFAELMAAEQLAKLATAHTLDDQAETVLMWFLRGAGARGLSGIAPRRELRLPATTCDGRITVIRPLLEVFKTEILQYLTENKIAYRRDESNLDPSYLRNWLRWHLLPELRQRFGERLPLRLVRQAQLIGDEDGLLDRLAREKLAAVRDADALQSDLLARESPALQRRIVRLWIDEVCGALTGVSYVHVADILRLNHKSGRQARLSIARGWELVREYGALRLRRTRNRPSAVSYSYNLIVGETLHIPEARLDVISERLPPGLESASKGLTEALFDGAFLTAPLQVRNFRRGDSYQPLGMRGHKKIKDLFIERKIPRHKRARLPLFTVDGAIVWIPGCGRSELGKVTAQSQSLVRFKIRSTPV
jgi:tRNA(Ile)-lysidine synthase